MKKKYSINPPHNEMVQDCRGVYMDFSRHAIRISNVSNFVSRKFEERPLQPYSLQTSKAVQVVNVDFIEPDSKAVRNNSRTLESENMSIFKIL